MAKRKIKKVCGTFAAATAGVCVGIGIDVGVGVSGCQSPFSRPEVAYNFEPCFKWAAAATVTATVTKTALSYAANGESGKTGDAWTIELGSAIAKGTRGKAKSV